MLLSFNFLLVPSGMENVARLKTTLCVHTTRLIVSVVQSPNTLLDFGASAPCLRLVGERVGETILIPFLARRKTIISHSDAGNIS